MIPELRFETGKSLEYYISSINAPSLAVDCKIAINFSPPHIIPLECDLNLPVKSWNPSLP